MTNPLLERSHLPYQLPDFAALTPEHYREAFETGTAQQLAALDALATDPEPATVENVLHVWDTSGDLLARTSMVFYAVKAADTTPELDALYEVAVANGALGGKVLGAGGGGYLLLMCDPTRRAELGSAMTAAGAPVTRFTFTEDGAQVWRAR